MAQNGVAFGLALRTYGPSWVFSIGFVATAAQCFQKSAQFLRLCRVTFQAFRKCRRQRLNCLFHLIRTKIKFLPQLGHHRSIVQLFEHLGQIGHIFPCLFWYYARVCRRFLNSTLTIARIVLEQDLGQLGQHFICSTTIHKRPPAVRDVQPVGRVPAGHQEPVGSSLTVRAIRYCVRCASLQINGRY